MSSMSAASGSPDQQQPGVVRVRPAWHPGSWLALARGRPLLAAVVVLTIVFLGLTALILRSDLQPTSWDIWITYAIQTMPDGVFGTLLVWVSAPGFSPWQEAVIIAAVGFMLLRRWFAEAVFTIIASLGGLLTGLIKVAVDRPRPTADLVRLIGGETHGMSFPSGHVTQYVALFGFLFYLAYTLLPRRSPVRLLLLIVFGLLIVLVGPSRIYMGHHWTSDVLAGFTVGLVWLLGTIEAYRLWLHRHPKAPVVKRET